MGSSPASDAVVVGIDLAGWPTRATGLYILRGRRAEALVAGDDDEIVARVRAAAPVLVTIDAPLALPRGRRTIHDRRGEHFRRCDRELQRRGIRFFPITLGPMRMLTERGMRLKQRLRRAGLRQRMTGDELDAATIALAGRWELEGRGERIGGRGRGEGGRGGILLPRVAVPGQTGGGAATS